MPSAASFKVEKDRVEALDPFKQAITVVEHKIRNLEKRKSKLDSYKDEQSQGKDLNADQLAAVAKYPEVVQQLEFSRDLVKQLTQISNEAARVLKKQSKKEQAEKSFADLERFKEFLTYQSVLQHLRNPNVIQQFIDGVPGTVKLSQEDVATIEKLSNLLFLNRCDPDFSTKVGTAAECFTQLLDGKGKSVDEKSYKEMKELLSSLSSCDYIVQLSKPKPVPSVTEEMSSNSVIANNDNITSQVGVNGNGLNPSQVEAILSYLVMEQIEQDVLAMESPHMDPAIVSYVPPVSMCTPPENINVYNNVGDTQMIGTAMGDLNLNNIDHVSSVLNHVMKSEEPIDEWDSNENAQNTGVSEFNEAPTSQHSGNRGGYRGGRNNRGNRGSGYSNGYGRNSRGNGRPFNQEKMGVYRSERSNDRDQEKSRTPRSGYRGGNNNGFGGPRSNGVQRGGRGNGARSYRGGGNHINSADVYQAAA